MKILITGASGQLGAYLIDQLVESGHEIHAWSGSQSGQRSGVSLTSVDLTNFEMIDKLLDRSNPDAIIHAAALSAAEAVRLNPDRARSLNVEATIRIARWASDRGRRLIFTSTDLVFDGSRPWNREDDPAEPILAYGRTKREAEPAVLEVAGGVVARICLLFGLSRCGRPSFFDRAMDAIQTGQTQSFFEDEYRTPLDLATAALILARLAESNQSGLFHVGGTERMSRFELMRRASAVLGHDSSLVLANRRTDFELPEPRPADVSLDTTRLSEAFPDVRRPTIEESLRS